MKIALASECQQGSDTWYRLKRGIPSASNFHRIFTPGGKLSEQAHGYICELIGEQKSEFMPERIESWTSRPVQWGIETEAEARRCFSLETNLDVTEVGFLIADNGHYGCSPDGMIREGEGEYIGTLEMKCPLPKTQVEYLLSGEMPPDYLPQVHGQLIVTGLPEARFFSYCPGLQPFLVTVKPDSYTQDLRRALEDFHGMYQEALAKLGYAPEGAGDEWKQEKAKRQELLDIIQSLLTAKWPKKTGKDRDSKVDTIEAVFSTREWKKVQALDSQRLQAGLKAIQDKINLGGQIEQVLKPIKEFLGTGPTKEQLTRVYAQDLPLFSDLAHSHAISILADHLMKNGWKWTGKEVVNA